MKNTKQRILDVSLDLFSQKGFTAVSIRDICQQVGIKESTIYYYFKSKHAIFDDLLRQFSEKAGGMMAQLEAALAGPVSSANGSFYKNVCDNFFENYLMDDFCNRILRLLSIEQFSDSSIREIYDQWMFARPLAFQNRVFSILMEKGILSSGDSTYLSVRYYAPICLFAQRYLLSGPLSEERKNMFRAEAYHHIENFFKEIMEA